MTRRLIILSCFMLLITGRSLAQAPPPETEAQPGRVFCEQNVSYRLADPSTIPESYRRFLGAWTDAAWDADTCAALIVDDVKPDGSASIIYVYGPWVRTRAFPAGFCMVPGSSMMTSSGSRIPTEPSSHSTRQSPISSAR